MSKKKVIVLSVVLILAIAYISRVAYVNIVQAPVKIVQYSIGDKIKHCNYQLQVTNYKIPAIRFSYFDSQSNTYKTIAGAEYNICLIVHCFESFYMEDYLL